MISTLRILCLGWLLLAGIGVQAAEINDANALRGVKEGKGVFLLDIGNPKKLLLYLEVIAGTHAGMRDQGVRPDFIGVFIGPSVKFLTQRPSDELEMEYEAELERIAAAVARLKALGMRLEVCAVATRVFGIDNQTLLPELELVADGFVSLIGYQTQGYHLVPIY